MEERRTPEQDKNGGTVFPVTVIKQVKTNQAVGRHFLLQQLFVIVAFLELSDYVITICSEVSQNHKNVTIC